MKINRIALVAAATLAASMVASAPASSASPTGRDVTKEYSMSNGMVASGSQAYWNVGTAYKVFKARRGERHVILNIADQASPSVRGHYHLDVDGDGKLDEGKDFCNESQPIRIDPGQRIEVAVLMGECPGGDPSVVTEGTITATFTR